MNGKEILVDTNIVLYLLDGSDTLASFLEGKKVYLSFISELELLGYKDIDPKQEKEILELISDCSILPLTDLIKRKYVALRKLHKIKLADALTAATAIVMGVPLITSDADFKKISELDLITYKHGIDLT